MYFLGSLDISKSLNEKPRTFQLFIYKLLVGRWAWNGWRSTQKRLVPESVGLGFSDKPENSY
jgi:hypothetical protein